jgi:hypothetical protein
MHRLAKSSESVMISNKFKSVLAAIAIAVPVCTAATTDAFAFGGHFGGGHFGGHHFGAGPHFGGGHWGGGRHFGGHWGGYRHAGWGYGPRRVIYVGGCGYGLHYSHYWGRCVPNY